jgi:hypothetical protein
VRGVGEEMNRIVVVVVAVVVVVEGGVGCNLGCYTDLGNSSAIKQARNLGRFELES